MRLFGNSTDPERDHNRVIELEKQLGDLRHEVDALERKLSAVDLHAKVIVEEAKRLIVKFERRLDREGPPEQAGKGPQDAPGTTKDRLVGYGQPPLHERATGPRRNY